MNARIKQPPVVLLPLDGLTLHADLQARVVIERATWEEYLYLLGDGTDLPPVTVFDDGETKWLADGYHRWHAHKALGVETINATVLSGDRDAALQHSLSANALHGKRREPADYRKGYKIGCKYGLFKPEDSRGVSQLLGCSRRMAYDLTDAARKRIEAEQDAAIKAAKAAGKSTRAIAKATGIPSSTVSRRAKPKKGVPNLPPGKMGQPEPPDPTPEPPGLAEFREMTSPRGERWFGALRGLQAICGQASVDDLLADRYTGIEHVFEPALRQAHAWIGELHRRYFDDGK
jgi:hypothetical protein